MTGKQIEGYEDYIIYPDGRIYSNRLNRLLVCNHGDGFYKTFRLSKDGKPKTFKLHSLLAKAFIPNPLNKREVNHKDGNKLNNNLDNLEWVTHHENMIHSWNMGLTYISDKNIKAATEAKFKPLLNTENGVFYDSIKDAREIYGFGFKKIPSKFVRV